jgi:hypothetical protein
VPPHRNLAARVPAAGCWYLSNLTSIAKLKKLLLHQSWYLQHAGHPSKCIEVCEVTSGITVTAIAMGTIRNRTDTSVRVDGTARQAGNENGRT